MKLNLSADEVLSTTRAVRKRLDFDRPVELSVIKECLEYAVQAPTGSNLQGWQWLVVTDPEKRKGLADLYRQGWAMYTQMAGAATNIESADPDQQARVVDSATYMAENFEKAPAMLIPCLPGRLDGLPNMAATSMYGSILPGAWSFMLAARERGLGTAWTTIHLIGDGERQAKELLGIPDGVTQAGMFPIAYTIGTDFKQAKRLPLDPILHWDRW